LNKLGHSTGPEFHGINLLLTFTHVSVYVIGQTFSLVSMPMPHSHHVNGSHPQQLTYIYHTVLSDPVKMFTKNSQGVLKPLLDTQAQKSSTNTELVELLMKTFEKICSTSPS
jgi:hypothetical protein